MSVSPSPNTALALAYLRNAQAVLANNQPHQTAALLEHAMVQLQSAFDDTPLLPAFSCWSVGVGLDTGLKRSVNEDYLFEMTTSRPLPNDGQEPVGIFVVADGIGGHTRGDVASRCAVHTFADSLLPHLLSNREFSPGDLHALLAEGVQAANRAVYRKNREAGVEVGSGRSLMGTTLAAALCVGSRAVVANVGDSRTYVFRRGALYQVSRDHSYVFDQVAAGVFTPDQFYTHPQRNVIYRCLGETEEVAVDLFALELMDGDLLLLCSDGLWEMVPDQSLLARVLASSHLDPEQMAQQLVHLALAGGGLDNIGLLVARYQTIIGANQDGTDIADAPTIVLPANSSTPALAS